MMMPPVISRAAATMPPAIRPALAPSETIGFGVGANGDIRGAPDVTGDVTTVGCVRTIWTGGATVSSALAGRATVKQNSAAATPFMELDMTAVGANGAPPAARLTCPPCADGLLG